MVPLSFLPEAPAAERVLSFLEKENSQPLYSDNKITLFDNIVHLPVYGVDAIFLIC